MINEIKDEYDLKNNFDCMNGRDINGNILPLIRLRVFRGLFAAINVQRFGSQFMHKVANPKGQFLVLVLVVVGVVFSFKSFFLLLFFLSNLFCCCLFFGY